MEPPWPEAEPSGGADGGGEARGSEDGGAWARDTLAGARCGASWHLSAGCAAER
jgi:hypothetical protein